MMQSAISNELKLKIFLRSLKITLAVLFITWFYKNEILLLPREITVHLNQISVPLLVLYQMQLATTSYVC